MVFYSGQRIAEVEELARVLDSWAERNGVLPVWIDDTYAMPVPVKAGVEKDEVVASIVEFWRAIWTELAVLPSPE